MCKKRSRQPSSLFSPSFFTVREKKWKKVEEKWKRVGIIIVHFSGQVGQVDQVDQFLGWSEKRVDDAKKNGRRHNLYKDVPGSSHLIH